MIRWFTDLPIERKLRVVILVPAIAVFSLAMMVHVGMNLLHLRDDLQWSAARIARVTGASAIDALRLGDDKAALKAVKTAAPAPKGDAPKADAAPAEAPKTP